MPCLVAVVALMAPRVALFFIWLLTNWFSVFQTWYGPLLGFLFMPYTTLAYMAAMHHGGITGGWLALVIIAAFVDAGHWGGSGRTWHHRRIVVVKHE
jgi:hypothetical protein